MWARVILLTILLAAALLVLGEAWLRLRRQPLMATPRDMLQPSTVSLDWSDVQHHIRIVALGDSIVHGHMVPVDKAWPAGLEKRLREQYSHAVWTVVNSGICGETALQGWARLDRDALRFRPHLLLIAFGLNDCYLARSSVDAWREVETFPEQTYGPLGRSRLYRSARRRLLPEEPAWQDGAVAWRPRLEPEAFVASLDRMVRAAQRAGVPHIALLTMTPVDEGAHPYWAPEVQDLQMATYHRYNDLLRTTAESLGVGLIDVEVGFAGSDLAPLLDYDSIHLTAAGQQVLADVVYGALYRNGMLASLSQLRQP